MRRRVVVTGVSVVTALGLDVSEFWDKLCAGKSGIGPLERFDCSDYKVRFGGEIKDFNAADYTNLSSKDLKRVDRFVQFGLVGAHIAYRQAQLEGFEGDPYRRGVLIGSGIGGLNEIENQHDKLYNQGPARVSPFMIPKLMVNAASGNISAPFADLCAGTRRVVLRCSQRALRGQHICQSVLFCAAHHLLSRSCSLDLFPCGRQSQTLSENRP